VKLSDGRVLVSGGYAGVALDSAAIYDPVTGDWSPAAPMDYVRGRHTATLLTDGRVLVVGGYTLSEYIHVPEVYDPATNIWDEVSEPAVARSSHSATLLLDGRVLVSGGYGVGAAATTAEVYDPVMDTWTPQNMSVFRALSSQTLLEDGRVLVAGGQGPDGAYQPGTAEIYAAAAGSWSPADAMSGSRYAHAAARLPDGRVLVAGGFTKPGDYASSEIYDAAADEWSEGPSMRHERTYASATLLADGSVLLASGDSAERYYPDGYTMTLFEGWNQTVPWQGLEAASVPEVLELLGTAVFPAYWDSVAHYEDDAGVWQQTFRDAPLPGFNTLEAIAEGEQYWIFVFAEASLSLLP
jgi:hypothetical protein